MDNYTQNDDPRAKPHDAAANGAQPHEPAYKRTATETKRPSKANYGSNPTIGKLIERSKAEPGSFFHVLIDPAKGDELCRYATPEDYVGPHDRIIAEIIFKLRAHGEIPDLDTIGELLEEPNPETYNYLMAHVPRDPAHAPVWHDCLHTILQAPKTTTDTHPTTTPGVTNTPEKKKSQADTLIGIGLRAELFRTPDDEPHATIERDGHLETHRLKSSSFRDYLKSRHFQETGKAPSAQATQDALDTLAGFAYESGIRHETHLRISSTADAVYLDLGDDKWRAVEITPQGWKIVDRAPVKFIRARGVLPLPEPQRGGKIEELRQYINIANNEDFQLLVGWELSAFQPHGALPILNITGPQGSAKSVTTRHARQLIDPNATPTRSMPRSARDLMIAAKNSATASFDNVSTLEDWLSDAMCSLSTGAGYATRELHSDGEEILITAKRRGILNGITGTGDRADFLDRCIILSLPRISDSERRLESEVESGFKTAHGKILGAILDAVSAGLKNLPETKIPEMPRMADFAVWATACESGLGWEPDTFIKAYKANLKEGVEVAADASPIVAALRSYIAQHERFEGTTANLSKALNDHVGEAIWNRKGFPSGSQSLGHALKRAVTVLLTVGIEATCKKEETGKVWTIRATTDKAPNPDDVADDVEQNDDVADDVAPTSSATQAQPSNDETKKPENPDDADDVQPSYSFSVSRHQKKEEKSESDIASLEDYSASTSSASSASSASVLPREVNAGALFRANQSEVAA
jgi:hypothetical protein